MLSEKSVTGARGLVALLRRGARRQPLRVGGGAGPRAGRAGEAAGAATARCAGPRPPRSRRACTRSSAPPPTSPTRCSRTRPPTTVCGSTRRGSRRATWTTRSTTPPWTRWSRAVTGRYDIVARYYRLKRRLLGLDELFDYDRYAPLPAAERRYSLGRVARRSCSTPTGGSTRAWRRSRSQFFDKRWIDAAVHAGQARRRLQHGLRALRPPLRARQLPRQDRRRDDRGARARPRRAPVPGPRPGHPPRRTPRSPRRRPPRSSARRSCSTTCSRRERDAKVKLAMLVREIEGGFATVFRQVAMNRFEEAMHTARGPAGSSPPRTSRASGSRPSAPCSATASR